MKPSTNQPAEVLVSHGPPLGLPLRQWSNAQLKAWAKDNYPKVVELLDNADGSDLTGWDKADFEKYLGGRIGASFYGYLSKAGLFLTPDNTAVLGLSSNQPSGVCKAISPMEHAMKPKVLMTYPNCGVLLDVLPWITRETLDQLTRITHIPATELSISCLANIPVATAQKLLPVKEIPDKPSSWAKSWGPLLCWLRAYQVLKPNFVQLRMPDEAAWLREALMWFGSPMEPLMLLIKEESHISPIIISLQTSTLLLKHGLPAYRGSSNPVGVLLRFAKKAANLFEWMPYLEGISSHYAHVNDLPPTPDLNATNETQSRLLDKDRIYLDLSGTYSKLSHDDRSWTEALLKASGKTQEIHDSITAQKVPQSDLTDAREKTLAQLRQWIASNGAKTADERYLLNVVMQLEALCPYFLQHPQVSHLERWWEINQNGPLIDSCFLRNLVFDFKRTEVKSVSSETLRPESLKLCDGLLSAFDADKNNGAQELLYLETSQKDDQKHSTSNLIKVAHLMRSAVILRLSAKRPQPAYGIIVEGPLITLYRLELLWRDTFCMQQLYTCSLGISKDTPLQETLTAWLSMAARIMALSALLGAQAHALRDAVPCFEFTNAPPVSVTPQRASPLPRMTGGQHSAFPVNSSTGDVFTKEVTKQQHADAELYALTRLSGQPHIVPLLFVLPSSRLTGHVFGLKALAPWQRRLHCSTVDRVLLFIRQLLVALKIVHGADLLHGDLHSGNILFDEATDLIYLADFGLSRSTQVTSTCTGTTGYLAPEVAACRSQGPEADLWAAGILFANLLEDHVPCLRDYALTVRDLAFAEHLCADLTAAVESDKGLRSAAAVVCALLQTEPSLRPTAEAALALLPTNATASLPTASGVTKAKKVRPAPLSRRDSNLLHVGTSTRFSSERL